MQREGSTAYNSTAAMAGHLEGGFSLLHVPLPRINERQLQGDGGQLSVQLLALKVLVQQLFSACSAAQAF